MKLDLSTTPELHLAAIDILARAREPLSDVAIAMRLIAYGYRTTATPIRLLKSLRSEMKKRPFTFCSPIARRWCVAEHVRRAALV